MKIGGSIPYTYCLYNFPGVFRMGALIDLHILCSSKDEIDNSAKPSKFLRDKNILDLSFNRFVIE